MHFLYPNGYIQFGMEEALDDDTILWMRTVHPQKRLQQALLHESMNNLLLLVMIMEVLQFAQIHGNMPFQLMIV